MTSGEIFTSGIAGTARDRSTYDGTPEYLRPGTVAAQGIGAITFTGADKSCRGFKWMWLQGALLRK